MEGDHPYPPDAERLVQFIEVWSVKGSMSDGSRESDVSGIWTFSRTADGWGVRGDLTTVIEGSGSFSEWELIGLDSVSGKIHLLSLCRFTIRDHVGGWSDEQTLVTL